MARGRRFQEERMVVGLSEVAGIESHAGNVNMVRDQYLAIRYHISMKSLHDLQHTNHQVVKHILVEGFCCRGRCRKLYRVFYSSISVSIAFFLYTQLQKITLPPHAP
jgi:hypothetical protein